MVASLTPPDTTAGEVIRHVKTQFGMMISHDQESSFERELQRICVDQGFPDLHHLLQALKQGRNRKLEVMVTEAASVNHTHFFRENDVLNQLDTRVLAEIRPGHPVHIWSAAASSGEEAYTVAMMAWERHPHGEAVRILGTDISEKSVAHAQAGEYGERRLHHVSADRLKRYFDPIDGKKRYRVKPFLRQTCMFRRFNLLGSRWPFRSKFHAILLRNVLYYFSDRDQGRLLKRMYEQARPGGYLLVSVTESIGHLNTPWRNLAPGVYRKGSV